MYSQYARVKHNLLYVFIYMYICAHMLGKLCLNPYHIVDTLSIIIFAGK